MNLHLPHYPLPKGYDSADHYLIDLVLTGANRRYNDVFTPKVTEYIKYELQAIRKARLADFFLIWWDIAKYARENRILCGYGRNVMADSIVNYCLGITDVDPIQIGWCFDRYFSGRAAFPINSIETTEKGKQKLLKHLQQMCGEENFSYIQSTCPKPKHVGINPFAVLLTPQPVKECFEMMEVSENECVYCVPIQNQKELSRLGYVTIDIFDLRCLEVIERTLKTLPLPLDLMKIPLDDELTMQILKYDPSKIFLFESIHARKYLVMFNYLTFPDLMAVSAFYWQPKGEERLLEYIRRANGDHPVVYESKEWEPFLESTYGLLLYQEQFMDKVEQVDELNPQEADQARIEYKETLLYPRAHAYTQSLLCYQMAYLKAHYPQEFMNAINAIYHEGTSSF